MVCDENSKRIHRGGMLKLNDSNRKHLTRRNGVPCSNSSCSLGEGILPNAEVGPCYIDIAESVNSLLLECRSFPPLKLFQHAIDKINV